MRVFRAGGIALALAAGLCGPALAAVAERPRISIAGIRGDTGGAVAADLARALCTENACVPAARVRRAGKLDFAAVKAERVSAVLFGTVARGAHRLELALLTTSLQPRRTWALPLAGGRVAPAALERLADDVREFLRGAAPAAPPARATTRPPPAAAGRPAPTADGAQAAPQPERAAALRPKVAGALPAERSRAAAAPEGEEAAAPALRMRTEQPRDASGFGALDLGMLFARRDLAFQGAGAGPAALQKYEAAAVPALCARLELYPLAASSDGWAAGLGLLGTYARSVGFESKQSQTPGVTYATTFQEADVGVGWRFRPVASSAATLRPRVAWRWQSFVVKGIGGLPDAHLSGPALGIDADVPVARRVGLLASLGYTRWTTANDLVGGSAGFFPSGSAWALGGEAGVSIGLGGPASLRLTAAYERTSYALSGASSYRATGATDAYLSGQGMIRIAF